MEKGLNREQLQKSIEFNIPILQEQFLYHSTASPVLFELRFPPIPRGPAWFFINTHFVPMSVSDRYESELRRTLVYKYVTNAHPNLYIYLQSEKDQFLTKIEEYMKECGVEYSFKSDPHYIRGRLSILDRFGDVTKEGSPSPYIIEYLKKNGYDGIYERFDHEIMQVSLFEPSRWIELQGIINKSVPMPRSMFIESGSMCYLEIMALCSLIIKLHESTGNNVQDIIKSLKKSLSVLMGCGVEKPFSYLEDMVQKGYLSMPISNFIVENLSQIKTRSVRNKIEDMGGFLYWGEDVEKYDI